MHLYITSKRCRNISLDLTGRKLKTNVIPGGKNKRRRMRNIRLKKMGKQDGYKMGRKMVIRENGEQKKTRENKRITFT